LTGFSVRVEGRGWVGLLEEELKATTLMVT
jgi:hypothetical protein